ncbi:hypothetical protein VNO77_18456 [Canavalia gladiata]|uniref:Uncharacterized protein n=1 Tax=Canavalia gladiata TaxID=3824 RepID=A0AAN9LQU0_CANGL
MPRGRYLYQGWTKSLICLNWTMVPINERLSRVTECDYRVLFEFCTRYTRFFLLPEGELSEILPMVKLLEYTQSKNRPR